MHFRCETFEDFRRSPRVFGLANGAPGGTQKSTFHPGSLTWNLRIHPWEKENHESQLPKHHFQVRFVTLRGVSKKSVVSKKSKQRVYWNGNFGINWHRILSAIQKVFLLLVSSQKASFPAPQYDLTDYWRLPSMLPRVLTSKLAILDPTCSFTRSSSRRPCLRKLLEKRAGEWIKKIKKITHPPSLLLNLHRHSLSVQLCLRQRATGSGRCERPNCQNSPGNVNTVITPCAELIDCHGGMCWYHTC